MCVIHVLNLGPYAQEGKKMRRWKRDFFGSRTYTCNHVVDEGVIVALGECRSCRYDTPKGMEG